MIWMTHLKKKHVGDIVHQYARRRLHHRRHLYIVVVINVLTVLSMIQIQEGCVVDMDHVIVRKVNVVEKDLANIPEMATRVDILVLARIKHAAHQQPML